MGLGPRVADRGSNKVIGPEGNTDSRYASLRRRRKASVSGHSEAGGDGNGEAGKSPSPSPPPGKLESPG